jgi:hypothetical protein
VHQFTYELPLLDYLFAAFKLDAELDHASFMENVAQEWGSSFLYAPEEQSAPVPATAAAV